MSNDIIRSVGQRTGGEIYIGVVGSVRSGKSTFIRRFIELKVLPFVKDEQVYAKIADELPQSAEGKTIMTVEPKFVPSVPTTIDIDDDLSIKVRLVDCVGYVIDSARGYLNEDGSERLIQTPWYTDTIPFVEAASIGTRKVIESHSNIGIVLTSDGSFGEFSREEYEKVEIQIIEELKELNKPFVVILNTIKPSAIETITLAETLAEKYGVSVIPIDVKNMENNDIDSFMKSALNEFDISEININVPSWINILDDEITYKREFNEIVSKTTGIYRKMKDVFTIQEALKECELFDNVEVSSIDPGTGYVDVDIVFKEDLFKKVIEEILGESIEDKTNLIGLLQKYKQAKKVYEKVGSCFKKLDEIGYDIAIPTINEMELDTPEVIKQSGRHGIKLKANAPAILMVKLNVESTFEPIIGSAEQSQELINHMLEDYQNDPEKLWNSEFFGRKLSEVINDGVKAKIYGVNENVLIKFKVSMEKVVNHKKGGIIAIVI